MKSLITSLVLILSVAFASAQDRGNRTQRNPEQMAKMQVERLTKELNLSQTQQDSIHKYVLSNAKEQQEIFKNAGDDRDAARKSIQSLREKHTQKVKSFLNEDQINKYDELAKQRGQRFNRQRRTDTNK